MKDADAMVKKMAADNMVVSNRMDGLRVSFHLYNTLDDVHAVLAQLEKNRTLAVVE
jgi:selenocysteine lyase/cysteine desulfurase